MSLFQFNHKTVLIAEAVRGLAAATAKLLTRQEARVGAADFLATKSNKEHVSTR